MQVETLSAENADGYDALVLSVPTSMLFQSRRYREFLGRILGDQAEARYLVAMEGGEAVGALPAFVRRNARYGPVVNSLPFIGSNGGVLVRPDREDRRAIAVALLEAFRAMADQIGAASATVINRPLEPDDDLYEAHTGFTCEDERIGQVTPLPAVLGEDAEIDAAIMAMIHQKTRNVIRKAIASAVAVRHSGELADMRALHRIHEDNMSVIGGAHKPWEIFEAIRGVFAYDDDYRVYVAEKDGEVIGALLVFYFNRIAEYFTPVTVAAHRVFQPQSLICLHAMREAVKRGCTHWNWGGTWKTQTGVYQFKSRWGTQDLRYRYFVRERSPSLRALDARTLLAEYPNFYAVPFGVLAEKA